MAALREVAGRILTPAGWLDGRLRFDGLIREILPERVDGTPPLILPGFVDLHVHGGGGADVMAGEAAIRTMARLHARRGTTALLATTVTAPAADTLAAAGAIAAVMAAPGPGEARIIGAHLEGPFINPLVLGAQPPFAVPPDFGLAADLLAAVPVKVLTLAPEVDPEGRFLQWLAGQGVRVQLGHTACSYAEAALAFHRGAAGVTHLFNAMSGLHHRKPGMAGAALAHAEYAEIILDFVHVEPGAARAAFRAIPKLYCITDASAAAGMPDGGGYRLGLNTVCKQDGAVRLADGTLAGSALTLDQALRNLVALGMPVEQASLRLSAFPCDYLGLADRGRLRPGAIADFAILDAGLAVRQVVVAGVPLGD